jgi:hypothetical protein
VLFFTSLLIAVIGCGDGVGHPIVSGASLIEGAAGSGGAASSGGVASSAGGAGGMMTGVAGVSGETPGLGGAPNVLAGAGGAAGGRVEFKPPWDGNPGGEGNPDHRPDMHPVPDGDLCRPAANWDPGADAAERELLQLLNVARYYGIACDGGVATVATPLRMLPELRCAARLHSRNMSEGDFCSHVNLQDMGPEDRIRATGLPFGVVGESILCDAPQGVRLTPTEVSTRLVAVGGSDCKNLVDARFTAVGIGRFEDFWTLDFAGL